MSDFELFPKKCIKCKKENINLHEFPLSRSLGFSPFRVVSANFPVCDSCEKDFKNFEKIGSLSAIFFIFAMVLVLITIILTLTYRNSQLTFVLLIFTIGSAILGTGFYIITLIHPNRISRFISLKRDGKIRIKDSELEKETEFHISEKKKMLLYKWEQEIDVIFCPKCGSKHFNNTDFCKNCGKELRNL